MDISLSFPGGKRVDAHFGAFTVHTDQPPELGGADEAPAPYDLFLASLATCAGIFALGFCQSRGLSTEGLALRQTVELDPTTHLATAVRIHLTPPRGFPEKYLSTLARVVESCKVKKSILHPPEFFVSVENIPSPQENPIEKLEVSCVVE